MFNKKVKFRYFLDDKKHLAMLQTNLDTLRLTYDVVSCYRLLNTGPVCFQPKATCLDFHFRGVSKWQNSKT
jgi:hypothetical protein